MVTLELWFAWNSLPLRGKATASEGRNSVAVSCDLLEIRYLWEVKQQLNGNFSSSSLMLWFAWNSLPLRGKATAQNNTKQIKSSCDLLEIRYLWEVKQQPKADRDILEKSCDLLEIRYLWEVKQQHLLEALNEKQRCDLLEIRYLWEVKQQHLILSEYTLVSCDLLEIRYLWEVKQQQKQR